MAWKKSILLSLAIFLFAAFISGCTGSTSSYQLTQTADSARYPMTMTDDMGRVITFNASPQRIISMAPSNTEILYALGLEDRIVGVDCYSNYPEAAKTRPKMGGMVNVSVDEVLAAKPDLILVSQFTPAETIDQLDAYGLKVFCTHPDNATDAERTIMTIGRICNVPDKAQQVYNRMKMDVGPILEKTSRLNESRIPTVLVIITLDPTIYVADPGNYLDDLIKIGGGRNVATGAVMTPEEIDLANPDVIIVPLTYWTESTYNDLKNGTRPWMSNLSAVKAGKIYTVDYDLAGRPGPRIGAAASAMARTIHPEMFE